MMLKMEGVHAHYGHIHALRGIDVEVQVGEIVTLIGANGAGKSTLMMSLFGNPKASAGRIVFDGEDITRVHTHEIARRGIALVPEGRRIFPRMTVIENLQMGTAHADPANYAVGRRAADAGDRPRADEPAQAAAARRTLARPGADLHPADLPDRQGAQPRPRHESLSRFSQHGPQSARRS